MTLSKIKIIAVAAGLLAVIAIFGAQALGGSFPVALPFIKNPELSPWETFQKYLDAARNHDIERLGLLSHQLSPACQDTAEFEECQRLMDTVVFFAGELKGEYFTNTEEDAKQLVLYTDYVEGVRTLIYFTKGSGTLKVLGIKFCTEGEQSAPECFDNPAESKTDSDGDGFWDVVEAQFR